MSHNPIQQFNNDLQWLQNSPSLIGRTNAPTHLVGRLHEWVATLGAIPATVKVHEQDHPSIREAIHTYKRLGNYAEFVFAYWARHQPEIQLLDWGVQLKDSQANTAGELDFLLSVADTPVHVEMAVKFYLMKDHQGELASFVGPNARDRFDLKYEKMFYKQSQWLQKQQLKQQMTFNTALSLDMLAQPWHSAVLIKGMLFHHWKSDREALRLPDVINTDCHWGKWCYQREWEDYLSEHPSTLYWKPLPRLQWLSQVFDLPPSEAIKREEIRLQVEQSRRPLMIAALHEKARKNLQEHHRIVVVPNTWPAY